MLKICQIIDKDTEGKKYLETARGVILQNSITLPCTFSVEVIDWKSEHDFQVGGEILTFTTSEVELTQIVKSIREDIEDLLLPKGELQ